MPPQARERAEKESLRFNLLSEKDRANEISQLSEAKKVIDIILNLLVHFFSSSIFFFIRYLFIRSVFSFPIIRLD